MRSQAKNDGLLAVDLPLTMHLHYSAKMASFPSFTTVDLGKGLPFFVGRSPDVLHWDAAKFTTAWNLHPEVRPSIHIVGRKLQVPPWHQAYGEDNRFSGQVTRSQSAPFNLPKGLLGNWI